MRRALWFCITILFLCVGLWEARVPLHLREIRQAPFVRHAFAQAFVGTRVQDFSWARSVLSDYVGLPEYQSANKALPPANGSRVVFYGDSITDLWERKYPQQFFPGKHYIDRGITGQSTPEMVWRFQQDVIDLHPSTVVILAGTNDITIPDRRVTPADTRRNLQAMVKSARGHNIHVILCAVPPSIDRSASGQQNITGRIIALDGWLRTYAAEQHIPFVDYYTPMATAAGTLQPGLSDDGTHPNAAGYSVMQPLAQQAIDSANR